MAVREAPRAIEAANAVGMIYWQVMRLASAVEVFAEAGLHAEARAQAALGYEFVRGTCLEYLGAEIRVIEAYVERREGNAERCRALLREGFSHAARLHPNWTNASLFGRVMAAMCAEALDAGIEAAYVKSLIRRFRLEAPMNASEAWPWCTKIYTLGCFKIWCNEERLEFNRKAPKKPLALLKALIALGSQSVPEERLMDALWPNEEGDFARKSLDINVHRLRKLLGTDDAIIVREEQVSLNPQLCWVDIWAFDRLGAGIEEGNAARCDAASATDRALTLYQGEFLPSEANAPWALKQRERTRVRFSRLIESAAAGFEAANQWERAIGCYQRGLGADELAEQFHQGLMRCYKALGRHADAISAYRRLRQTLSVILGIAPSEASQSLAKALQRENPAHSN